MIYHDGTIVAEEPVAVTVRYHTQGVESQQIASAVCRKRIFHDVNVSLRVFKAVPHALLIMLLKNVDEFSWGRNLPLHGLQRF